ncbi:unnamed protein product [Ostreobium quekettii]|uniref:Uncharacterized protein n=1 Tax=Ostreobium quekettii TaxID=121088 RepID=A0A8S1IYJ7_9CHLO|nr:unnamed protein product [Ostreobium quekettii]
MNVRSLLALHFAMADCGLQLAICVACASLKFLFSNRAHVPLLDAFVALSLLPTLCTGRPVHHENCITRTHRDTADAWSLIAIRRHFNHKSSCQVGRGVQQCGGHLSKQE